VKTGKNARYTESQREKDQKIATEGATAVGKNAAKAGLKGQRVPYGTEVKWMQRKPIVPKDQECRSTNRSLSTG
jgi:hypothetical protein